MRKFHTKHVDDTQPFLFMATISVIPKTYYRGKSEERVPVDFLEKCVTLVTFQPCLSRMTTLAKKMQVLSLISSITTYQYKHGDKHRFVVL